MRDVRIPAAPGEITAGWLTHALREGGVLNDGSVASFETAIIGEGAGLMGQLARISIRYDRPQAAAPGSLIAKFPAATPENREVANLFRYYEREIRFYEDIADEVELRTPRRYYSAMDTGTGDFVLLLEDMAPARVGDQLGGCSAEEADLAIQQVAKFHATWWQNPRLDELEWMPLTHDPVHHSAEESYQKAWDTFVAEFGKKLTADQLRIAEQLGTNVINLLMMMGEPPRTIIHGDYRLDNMFFGTPEGGDPLAVIDWQISSRGRGIFDVAYFISGNLRLEERRARGMEILRNYHRTLVENGVRDYSWEQCLHDYRLCTLFVLVYTVISGGTLDLANERGRALVSNWVDRAVTAIDDLDCGALMPK